MEGFFYFCVPQNEIADIKKETTKKQTREDNVNLLKNLTRNENKKSDGGKKAQKRKKNIVLTMQFCPADSHDGKGDEKQHYQKRGSDPKDKMTMIDHHLKAKKRNDGGKNGAKKNGEHTCFGISNLESRISYLS